MHTPALTRFVHPSSFARRLAVVALVLTPTPASAQPIAVEGTGVSLEPPAGFTPATTYPGFEQTDAAASIIVVELPAPVDAVLPGMTEEALLERGMVLEDRQSARIADRDATILRVRQNAPNGFVYVKWLAIFGDDSQTVLLTAGVPTAKVDELGPALRSSLRSASWKPRGEINEAGLRFRIEAPEGLEPLARLADTLSWTDLETEGLAPFFVAGSSFFSPAGTELETFARLRLSQTHEISNLGDAEAEPVRLGDLPAVELLAEAEDAETGDPLVVYQVMAFDHDVYFLIQGFAEAKARLEWLRRFRAATATFELADQAQPR